MKGNGKLDPMRSGCICEWERIPEGEGIDPMYMMIEMAKRCPVHGKPRHKDVKLQ